MFTSVCHLVFAYAYIVFSFVYEFAQILSHSFNESFWFCTKIDTLRKTSNRRSIENIRSSGFYENNASLRVPLNAKLNYRFFPAVRLFFFSLLSHDCYWCCYSCFLLYFLQTSSLLVTFVLGCFLQSNTWFYLVCSIVLLTWTKQSMYNNKKRCIRRTFHAFGQKKNCFSSWTWEMCQCCRFQFQFQFRWL